MSAKCIEVMEDFSGRLKAGEWEVLDAPLSEAQKMVAEHHYARGGSNTAVFVHGLYNKQSGILHGVAWWLPPTRVACESVNKERWKDVLSLTRMVIIPGTPKNAASFLLSRSVRRIRNHGRYASLVTYADEFMNHFGWVYRASNWTYVGRTGPYSKFHTKDGKQVAAKATKNRRKSEMEALGHRKVGSYYKHKFVIHLHPMKKYTTPEQVTKDIDSALKKIEKAKRVAQEHLDQEQFSTGGNELSELRKHREAADFQFRKIKRLETVRLPKLKAKLAEMRTTPLALPPDTLPVKPPQPASPDPIPPDVASSDVMP